MNSASRAAEVGAPPTSGRVDGAHPEGVIRLLGPQRTAPSVGDDLQALAPDGPVAIITAGWGDRERDGAELDALLGGRSVNLHLYHRQLDALARDPDLAAAERSLQEQLAEIREVYRLRLRHAIAAVTGVQRLAARDRGSAEDLEDTIDAVRGLDARHLTRIIETRAELDAAWLEREIVAEHRAEVMDLVAPAAAVAIAGGRVDLLLDGLRRLGVDAALGDRPVVAWSAGAMALTERVVLFHDRSPQGETPAEVHDRGLGRCPRVVVLPHARDRLALQDRDRSIRLARRFAPARCVLLDVGARLEDARTGPQQFHGASVLDPADGTVEVVTP